MPRLLFILHKRPDRRVEVVIAATRAGNSAVYLEGMGYALADTAD
jgi:hypothetical protein